MAIRARTHCSNNGTVARPPPPPAAGSARRGERSQEKGGHCETWTGDKAHENEVK